MGLSIPNLYRYRGLPLAYIIYWILILSTTISVFVYLLVNNIKENVADVRNLIMWRVMFILFIFSLIVSTMTEMVFIKRRKMVKLYLFLNSLEACLCKKFPNKTNHKETMFSLKFFLCIAIHIIIFLGDLVSKLHNFELNSFTIFCVYLLYFHVVVSVLILQVDFYSLQIGSIFHFVNSHMNTSRTKINESKEHNMSEIIFFIRRYDDLNRSVDMVKEVYEKIIIFIVICTNITTLCGVNIFVQLYRLEKKNIYIHGWYIIVFKNMVSNKIL